ncbi:hypothetical protein TREMEDRAFT_61095 [Tremella mesenterica DSM 1558]|uniref:uncharacterized protein n=1 Tax=Tremella mesenterica (strain ATCC 24925 / CBS 8224 / DSM 1558 / NBRC 9311 / NRRL Y-6157 / RJB 2259-6 / UBC 559-6) TaxID=578456 RepID=UPI0003F49AF6|nr:uncharacterized protein TREMEDRAFT_61095 [Tremella mesenterica DSM 1558]EIW70591.1 hypothetical protein TREMEDRAFT_61095 [Tremella mesenterica DSM 1558]
MTTYDLNNPDELISTVEWESPTETGDLNMEPQQNTGTGSTTQDAIMQYATNFNDSKISRIVTDLAGINPQSTSARPRPGRGANRVYTQDTKTRASQLQTEGNNLLRSRPDPQKDFNGFTDWYQRLEDWEITVKTFEVREIVEGEDVASRRQPFLRHYDDEER